MTAEERMAYFQGQKRRETSHFQAEKRREAFRAPENGKQHSGMLFMKLRLTIAVLLLIAFLSLDYTGYRFEGIGSGEIVRQVTTDFDFSKLQSFKFYEKFIC